MAVFVVKATDLKGSQSLCAGYRSILTYRWTNVRKTRTRLSLFNYAALVPRETALSM